MIAAFKFFLDNWRAIGALCLAAASYVAGAYHMKQNWDIDVAIQIKAKLAALEANQKLIVALQETKNENIELINSLRSSMAVISVRVPKAAKCSDTGGGKDETAGTRVVPVAPQEVFDGFRRELESSAYAADEIVESCRVLRDGYDSLQKLSE